MLHVLPIEATAETLRELGRTFGLTDTDLTPALKSMVCVATRTLLGTGLTPAHVMDLIPVKPRVTATSANESSTMKTKPACYGSMFPDLSKLEFNTPNEGKAFTVVVGSSMGITNRQSSVKAEEWDACTECPAYDRCYDLSMAKLLLHQAIQDYGMTRAL